MESLTLPLLPPGARRPELSAKTGAPPSPVLGAMIVLTLHLAPGGGSAPRKSLEAELLGKSTHILGTIIAM